MLDPKPVPNFIPPIDIGKEPPDTDMETKVRYVYELVADVQPHKSAHYLARGGVAHSQLHQSHAVAQRVGLDASAHSRRLVALPHA